MLTSRQLAEWEAFARLEPWGFEIENARAALVASTVANFAGKRASRELSLDDFTLRTRGAPKRGESVASDVLAVFGKFKRALPRK